MPTSAYPARHPHSFRVEVDTVTASGLAETIRARGCEFIADAWVDLTPGVPSPDWYLVKMTAGDWALANLDFGSSTRQFTVAMYTTRAQALADLTRLAETSLSLVARPERATLIGTTGIGLA